MKYIKKYEQFGELNIGEPEYGDYVILEISKNAIAFYDSPWINSEIAQLIKIINKFNTTYYQMYFDKYDKKYDVTLKSIKYWSKNKEELEVMLSANKYNL